MMEMQFKPRAEWRGRGRPPREPSPKVLKLCRDTHLAQAMGTLPLANVDQDAVREILADLRAAQRVLGGRVHYQIVDNELRFFWAPGG